MIINFNKIEMGTVSYPCHIIDGKGKKHTEEPIFEIDTDTGWAKVHIADENGCVQGNSDGTLSWKSIHFPAPLTVFDSKGKVVGGSVNSTPEVRELKATVTITEPPSIDDGDMLPHPSSEALCEECEQMFARQHWAEKFCPKCRAFAPKEGLPLPVHHKDFQFSSRDAAVSGKIKLDPKISIDTCKQCGKIDILFYDAKGLCSHCALKSKLVPSNHEEAGLGIACYTPPIPVKKEEEMPGRLSHSKYNPQCRADYVEPKPQLPVKEKSRMIFAFLKNVFIVLAIVLLLLGAGTAAAFVGLLCGYISVETVAEYIQQGLDWADWAIYSVCSTGLLVGLRAALSVGWQRAKVAYNGWKDALVQMIVTEATKSNKEK